MSANSETPNYKAREVDFGHEIEKALSLDKSEIKRTHSAHLDLGENSGSRIVMDHESAVGADGNNVDPRHRHGESLRQMDVITRVRHVFSP